MTKKIVYLFQPQDVIDSGDEENYWLPYSAACAWSYVHQFEDVANNFELKKIFFKREDHNFILDSIEKPDVVGFSFYIWNENYCLTLAKKIKTKWPDCKIIFGGEQVSGKYLKYEFIDSLIIAEGELSFLEVLRKTINKEPLPQILKSKRLDNLDIPSPYLNGVMDSVVSDHPHLKWATVIESNRGCPYSCTFCDWGGALQAKIKQFSLEKVQKELDWVKNNNVAYLFFADANFGIFKERDKTIAQMIRNNADNGILEAVNLQFAKNNVDSVFEIGKILGPFNRGITVSVQSMNPETLKAIKRTNLKVNDIEHIMKLSAAHEVDTYTEVILGLPLETKESWREGITQLLELGQHQSIDFGLAEVLENSELNQDLYKRRYGIKTIKVNQYYTISQDLYPEPGEVVYETSTMSFTELVDAYMYAWMIVHCHINGYTQLYSKYARYIYNISYRTFYDMLFKKLHSPSIVGNHFIELKNNFKQYLKTGNLNGWNEKGDSFHFASHKFCYDNRTDIFNIGQQVVRELNLKETEILKLQELSIYDLYGNTEYPQVIKSTLDIINWKEKDTIYEIRNKFQDIQDENAPVGIVKNYERLNFWFMRRKNLLKNKFIRVQ